MIRKLKFPQERFFATHKFFWRPRIIEYHKQEPNQICYHERFLVWGWVPRYRLRDGDAIPTDNRKEQE